MVRVSRRRQFDRDPEVDVEQVAHDVAVAGGPCPGRCNAAHRADPEHVEPRPGVPVWCRPCQVRIVDAVGRLPELVAVLASMPGGRLAAGGHSGRPVRSTAIVSPSGSPAWDACDEVISWAWETAVGVMQHVGEDPPSAWWSSSAAPVASLSTSVAALLRHADAWLAGPGAVEDGRRALRLVAEAERGTGTDPLVHRLPAPCPSCDTLALVREDGEDQVSCRVCHNAWTEERYRLLVRVLADAAQGAGA